MTTTTLVLTALPSQAPAPTPRLTVLVGPRLAAPSSGALTLADFALGDRPWPDLLREATLTVQFDTSSAPVSLVPATRPREALDAELWRDLFPRTTPVVPHTFDLDGRVIRSYPAAEVATHLQDLYRHVATSSPRDLPPVYHWTEIDQDDPGVTELDLLLYELGNVDQAISRYAGTPFEDSSRFLRLLSPRARAFYQAKRFYLRRRQGDVPPPLDLDDEPALPDLDFHQMVSLLADHPTVQRRLGLVFDVALPAPAWWPATGRIRVTATWSSSAISVVSPRTHYTLSAGRFLPRYHGGIESAPTHLADGYLRLDRSDAYGVVQVDTDGGALQSIDFAASVRREATELSRPPITETGLPTLRTGGITLVRHQRAAWLASRRVRAQDLVTAGATAELYAEDLLRGYRIDVSEGGGSWRSLCRRVGPVTAAGRDLSIPVGDDEEGYVKAASGTSTARNDELYLHEAIAGWDGWSLCARRPGRAVIFDKGDSERPPGEAIGDPTNEPNTWLDVQADYLPAPGSLPRLRFGRRYRLRARAVDLAGGSLPVGDTVGTYATPEIVYQRHEAVPPPVLVPRRRISEGESLEHMVIRSAPGLTPAEYVETPAVAGHGYTADNQRHVLAPKCTLAMAEGHGMLDAGLADPQRWYHVARKEAGSLVPSQDQLTYVDTETRSDVVMTGLEICHPPSAITGEAPAVPEHRGDPLAPGQYVIHTGTEVPMPWLPDPLALGFVLQDVTPAPGSTGPVTVYASYGARAVSWTPALASWPEKRSVRVVLQGATGDRVVRMAPGSDADTIVFGVPQGHQLRLRYSSLPDAARLAETALWHLLTDADRAALRDDIEHGKHWMLTPFRELVLVHAVQRPVTGPRLTGVVTARDPGETAIRLTGAMQSHAWSTSHVDVRAQWDDPVDDPAAPRPVMVRGSGDAFRVAIAYAQTSTPLLHQARAAERQLVTSPVPHTRLWNVDDVARDARHELGDTHHRLVTYMPVGTTRYQEYFPPAVIADPRNLQTEGEPLAVAVPSSARPTAPRVLYAVPTFAWDPPRSSEPDATIRRRMGSGLRIYLDRPWFSSGRGERLAVVCEEQPADWLAPHVSTWGRDPAWTGEALPTLRVDDIIDDGSDAKWFPGSDGGQRVVRAGGVVLPEAFVPVSVAGVIPQWSEERKLWYADVELNIRGAYWPFVSLALARWQPNAIDGCALSPVVRCHFAQIAPDRAASVVRQGDTVDVVLTGITGGNALEQVGAQNDSDPRPWWWWYYYGPHTYTSGAGHRVYARIEHQSPDAGPHDDLAWTTVRGPVELSSRWDGVNTVTWSGQLDTLGLPSGRLRVVVTEAEIYESDDPGVTVKVYGWEQYRTARERIVYVDTFSI